MPKTPRIIDDFRRSVFVGLLVGVVFSSLIATFPSFKTEGASVFDALGSEPRMGHASAAIEPVRGPRARVVPVLCHHFLRHNVTPFGVLKIVGALFLNLPVLDDMDVWTQTSGAFEKQIEWLEDHGYTTIDLDDLDAWHSGSRELPAKSVVITFDDGDRSVLDIAYPILRRHGMKATLFVVTSEVGQHADRSRRLTWEELRFLKHTGVFTIESHSAGLHYKVKSKGGYRPVSLAMDEGSVEPAGDLSWQEFILDDLEESRRAITDRIGHTPRHLSWPYGFSSEALDSLAAVAGFRTASTLKPGANEPFFIGSKPETLKVKRFTITARTSLRRFAEMLSE